MSNETTVLHVFVKFLKPWELFKFDRSYCLLAENYQKTISDCGEVNWCRAIRWTNYYSNARFASFLVLALRIVDEKLSKFQFTTRSRSWTSLHWKLSQQPTETRELMNRRLEKLVVFYLETKLLQYNEVYQQVWGVRNRSFINFFPQKRTQQKHLLVSTTIYYK